MKHFITFLLAAVLSFGAGAKAQQNPEQLKVFADAFYDVTNQQLSADGQWGSYRLDYDEGPDTLVVYGTAGSAVRTLKLPECRSVVLLRGNRALLQYSNYIQLKELGSGRVQTYHGSGAVSARPEGGGFLIHYREPQHKDLVFYGLEGKEQFRVRDCLRFVHRGNATYAVSKTAGQYSVYKTGGGKQDVIWTGNEEPANLEAPLNSKGLLIWHRKPVGVTVSFFDYIKGRNYLLPDGAEKYDEVYSVDSHPNDVFILSAQKQIAQNGVVPDIWYGEDRNLEHKFNPYYSEKTLVWDPRANLVSAIGTPQYPQSFSIGSSRYFLVYDAEARKDYTQYHTPLQLGLYDRFTKKTEDLGIIEKDLIADKKGRYLVYKKGSRWRIYSTSNGESLWLDEKGLENCFFSEDGSTLIFSGRGGIWKYQIDHKKLVKTVDTGSMTAEIVNADKQYLLTEYFYFHQSINIKQPVLLKLYREEDNISALGVFAQGKFRYLQAPTSDRIDQIITDPKGATISFRRQNFNMPPEIILNNENGRLTVGKSNPDDRGVKEVKQEIIEYLNRDLIPLKGVLYYPKNFDPNKKYPMITEIYELQHIFRNKYLRPSVASSKGSNLRLYIEQEYFVFLPDIVYGKEGPGVSALDCIHAALDAVLRNKNIDSERVALMGHSFGAYETNYVATQSKRFRTFVAGNGHYDLVHTYFHYAENFYTPYYMAFENGQYRMNGPFAEHKDLYFKNNPIYQAEKISAPVLLWAGTEDKHVEWRETRRFFNALKRNDKKVVGLFYPDEGHTLMSPGNQQDLTVKILEWFAWQLKDDRSAKWIDQK